MIMYTNVTKSSLRHFSQASRDDGASSGALALLSKAQEHGVDLSSLEAITSYLDAVRKLYDHQKDKAELQAIDACASQVEALLTK